MSATFTPGPWTACKDGNCSCGQVRGKEAPVATVTVGKWGDTYPALRPTKDSSELLQAYEPYIEMIEYGEVDAEVGKANALLIAAAPDLLAALQLFTSASMGGSGRDGESHIGWQKSDGPSAQERVQQARAAIAKALGK